GESDPEQPEAAGCAGQPDAGAACGQSAGHGGWIPLHILCLSCAGTILLGHCGAWALGNVQLRPGHADYVRGDVLPLDVLFAAEAAYRSADDRDASHRRQRRGVRPEESRGNESKLLSSRHSAMAEVGSWLLRRDRDMEPGPAGNGNGDCSESEP